VGRRILNAIKSQALVRKMTLVLIAAIQYVNTTALEDSGRGAISASAWVTKYKRCNDGLRAKEAQGFLNEGSFQ
jgi:hypothetical protein